MLCFNFIVYLFYYFNVMWSLLDLNVVVRLGTVHLHVCLRIEHVKAIKSSDHVPRLRPNYCICIFLRYVIFYDFGDDCLSAKNKYARIQMQLTFFSIFFLNKQICITKIYIYINVLTLHNHPVLVTIRHWLIFKVA